MQLSRNFVGLALFVMALASAGKATPLAAPGKNEAAAVGTEEPATYIVSHEEMMHWIANTDAELTFVGEPLNPLARRSSQSTMVTYCTRRIDNICGGTCKVYNGGAACLDAPGTECMSATRNVGHCSAARCAGTCNQLSTCRTELPDGFCFTPGTNSILVGA